jgi:hypothetical protein
MTVTYRTSTGEFVVKEAKSNMGFRGYHLAMDANANVSIEGPERLADM